MLVRMENEEREGRKKERVKEGGVGVMVLGSAHAHY